MAQIDESILFLVLSLLMGVLEFDYSNITTFYPISMFETLVAGVHVK